MATAFSYWPFLSFSQKREFLGSRSISIVQAGRAKARLTALEVVLPNPEPFSPHQRPVRSSAAC
ncbi:MAG: hypothetical protein OEM05_05765 [Myxococcales bacterium]|nr:hypothetical protein [Myxococcales bacterium]